MEYRKVGRSGLFLSEFSLGSWVTFSNQLDFPSATNIMALAFERGVNFYDNAETYGDGNSEIIMGKVLAKLNWSRDSFCVSSKVLWGGNRPTQKGLSRKHIVDACHNALKRLQVEYLDIFYCHRPDLDTPILETVVTMNHLITQGKVLYWGTSEWPPELIVKANEVAKQNGLVGPNVEQPEYNMFNRQKVEKDYLYLYEDMGLGLTTWSPLASGVLTGKYNESIPSDSRLSLLNFTWLQSLVLSDKGKEKISKVKLLSSLAQDYNFTTTQLSLLWCLQNKHVSTIILGASKLTQLEENLNVLDFKNKYTAELHTEIEKILNNTPLQEIDWKNA
ncbi:MAG: aldo/keto reductase [Bacteriovoracaceae bacterium]|jgi:voltage-dependent potassium channel beta subunit|nr:aldo/keto reductase [Bacteriovoracaceae bacterium]